MKTQICFFLGLALAIPQMSFAQNLLVQESVQPVHGEECTLHVDMKSVFPIGTALHVHTPAGTDEALERIELISKLVAKRGYRLVQDPSQAEFRLELSNGVSCVQTEGNPGRLASWVIENFEADITASGKFSGKQADGRMIENSFRKTFNGIRKKSNFKGQVGLILNYCSRSK
jgi:hypothetical protein